MPIFLYQNHVGDKFWSPWVNLHGWDWCLCKCICAVKYISISGILSIATDSLVLHDRNIFYCYSLVCSCIWSSLRVLVVLLVCLLELGNAHCFVLSTNPNLLIAGSIMCKLQFLTYWNSARVTDISFNLPHHISGIQLAQLSWDVLTFKGWRGKLHNSNWKA